MRIWLNSDYDIPDFAILLKEHFGSSTTIICTDHEEDAPLRAYADEFYAEPSNREQFIREHQIDIFIPRADILNIRHNLYNYPCKVLVEPNEYLYSLFNNKEMAYDWVQHTGIVNTPEVHRVTDFSSLYSIVKDIGESGETACIKKPMDIGGVSFREVISYYGADRLNFNPRRTITLSELKELYEISPIALLVMPKLHGPEISVDCIPDKVNPTFVPRIKRLRRLREYCYDTEVHRVVTELMAKINFIYPYNIQFMYNSKNELTFLEVNTRMSDGIHFSYALTGLNFPAIAVEKLLGREVEIKEKWRVDNVIGIPKAVQLSNKSHWTDK